MLNLRGETEEEHLRNLFLMSTDIPANRKVGDWVSTHVPWRRRPRNVEPGFVERGSPACRRRWSWVPVQHCSFFSSPRLSERVKPWLIRPVKKSDRTDFLMFFFWVGARRGAEGEEKSYRSLFCTPHVPVLTRPEHSTTVYFVKKNGCSKGGFPREHKSSSHHGQCWTCFFLTQVVGVSMESRLCGREVACVDEEESDSRSGSRTTTWSTGSWRRKSMDRRERDS